MGFPPGLLREGPLGALASLTASLPQGLSLSSLSSTSEALLAWGRAAARWRQCSTSACSARPPDPLSLTFSLGGDGHSILVCSFIRDRSAKAAGEKPPKCEQGPPGQHHHHRQRRRGEEGWSPSSFSPSPSPSPSSFSPSSPSCSLGSVGGFREISLGPDTRLRRLEVTPEGLMMQGTITVRK